MGLCIVLVNLPLQGRYSMVGAQPAMEIIAKQKTVTVMNHELGTRTEEPTVDPLGEPAKIAQKWKPVVVDGLPDAFCGKFGISSGSGCISCKPFRLWAFLKAD